MVSVTMLLDVYLTNSVLIFIEITWFKHFLNSCLLNLKLGPCSNNVHLLRSQSSRSSGSQCWVSTCFKILVASPTVSQTHKFILNSMISILVAEKIWNLDYIFKSPVGNSMRSWDIVSTVEGRISSGSIESFSFSWDNEVPLMTLCRHDLYLGSIVGIILRAKHASIFDCSSLLSFMIRWIKVIQFIFLCCLIYLFGLLWSNFILLMCNF